MGFEKDLPPGEKIVEYFLPFLQHLVSLDLSRKTIRKHTDNLWILGGEIIRDLNETPSLRKVLVEDLVFEVLQEGGPLLYHGDSEQQQRSFESTCRQVSPLPRTPTSIDRSPTHRFPRRGNFGFGEHGTAKTG
jgi:hypothetical protein